MRYQLIMIVHNFLMNAWMIPQNFRPSEDGDYW